ncbi:MAG: hypothetical protein EZS28_048353, partial [Streblomastix strix]
MFNKKHVRPSCVKDDILWDLVTKMLAFDRKDRLSAAEALHHPFFENQQAINEIPKEKAFHVLTLIASETRIKIYQKKNPYP